MIELVDVFDVNTRGDEARAKSRRASKLGVPKRGSSSADLKASFPNTSVASRSAPADTNTRTTSAEPATMSGVCPDESRVLTSAPASSRSRTHSPEPEIAAQKIGMAKPSTEPHGTAETSFHSPAGSNFDINSATEPCSFVDCETCGGTPKRSRAATRAGSPAFAASVSSERPCGADSLGSSPSPRRYFKRSA